MARQTVKQKRTALYCRLSKDDGNYGESSSIQSQKEILERYARENGFGNTSYYIDDGYTGTNFDRPDFQRMIADIESGEIATVITKDLSRLGRNYLETGVYLEMYFPDHNVRYIAINDSVDTIHSESVDYTPFRNIANEFYAKDTSKKVRSAKRARVLAGMYMGGSAPYGYRKDPNDKHKLLIDERYAPNVRKIFELAKGGKGISAIRKICDDMHFPRPAAVNDCGYTRYFEGNDDPHRYEWSNNSVRAILRNPVYAGNVCTNKRIRPSYKSKKCLSVLPEDYIVVHDTHEPIVSQEDFDLVQRMITSRRSFQKTPYSWDNIFSGIVKCADCGCAMTQGRAHRSPKPNPIDEYVFYCNTYKAFGKTHCTKHTMEARDLYEAVLEDIRKHAKAALANDAKMTEQLLKKMGAGKKKQSKIIAKELKEKRSRLSEVDRLFQKLYEDKVNGNISERNYQMMSRKYEEEQTLLQSRIDEIGAEVADTEDKADNVEHFTKLIRDYAGIEKLDATIVNTLIDRITIAEPKEVDEETVQEIKIYYKFIGHIL